MRQNVTCPALLDEKGHPNTKMEKMLRAADFSGKSFVLRIDEPAVSDSASTLVEDLRMLMDAGVRPVVVAPTHECARALVRAVNRTDNRAVGLSGADAALLPGTPAGIATVQAGILDTLADAGYVPVVEPTAFSAFGAADYAIVADDVACAIAAATSAVRALFFDAHGGVVDPDSHAVFDELTPAEALTLAQDARIPFDLRATARAAALGVRRGVTAAQIVSGRVAHVAVVELMTARHLGTQISSSLRLLPN